MGEWLSHNLVGLLGVLGGLTVAAVAVFRAKTERRSDRRTVEGERAIGMVENLYEAALLVDSDGKILLANQQMRHVCGYNSEELRGMNVNDLVPPRFRKAHLGHMRKFRDSPYPRMMGKSGMRLYLLDKSGIEKRVQISLRPKDGTTNGPEIILELRVIDDDLPEKDSAPI